MSEIWLSQQEVTDIENVTKRTFRRRFRVRTYPTFRYVESEKGGGKNGKKLEIALSSLSRAAQNRYLQKKYNRTHLTPQELAAHFHIILMARVKKGLPLITATKNYGIHKADLGITLRAWDDRAIEMALELIMGNKRRHQDGLTLYTIIKDTAEAEKEKLRIGTYASFMQMKRKISGAIKTYRDKGRQGLRQDVIPGIRRDATAYRPMECLVGDQHKADYYAIDSSGQVATLELFCWLDFRTQIVWGAVSYKHYNKFTVGQALTHAVRWGMPSICYTDWGKPEESNYVTMLIEQLTGLGVTTESIHHIKAEGRHPQAKPIEGFFGIFDRRLKNSMIPGYCKRLEDSRESELQQKELKRLIRGGGLLSVPELIDELIKNQLMGITGWNEHKFKAREMAPGDNGKSPIEIYTEEVKQYPTTSLGDDMLEYIFLPRRECLIKRSSVGFQHEYFGKRVYHDRRLADYQGTWATVRYHPYDISQVWIFERDTDKLICVADEWNTINPKVSAQVEAKRAEQKALEQQVKDIYKKYAPPTKPVRRINRHEREAREVSKVVELRIRKTSLEKQMEEQGTQHVAQGGADPLEEFRKQFHPDATKARMKTHEEKEYKPLFKLSMKQLKEEE